MITHALFLSISLIATVCDAGVLSSEWGMAPYSLRHAYTPELLDKTMECYRSRCIISAEYTMFESRMQAEFVFSDGDKNNGELLSVSLTKHYNPATGPDPLSPKQKLFKKLTKLYKERYGEPEKRIDGVQTLTWFDTRRNNSIVLEKRAGYINLDYAPISTREGRAQNTVSSH